MFTVQNHGLTMAKMFVSLLMLLGGLLALYLALLVLLWLRQEWLIFQPERLAPETRLSRDADVHEVQVPVPGAVLTNAAGTTRA